MPVASPNPKQAPTEQPHITSPNPNIDTHIQPYENLCKPLQVYSRRKADPKPKPIQSSEPVTCTEKVCKDVVDLDVPIAIRKRTRKCTQHPIANFMSFENISPSYRSFLTKLQSDKIPHNVEEALQYQNGEKPWNRRWPPLKRTELGIKSTYLKGRNMLDANRFTQLSIRQMVPWKDTKRG